MPSQPSSLAAHLADKKLLLWGLGKEGASSYRFLRRHFPEKPLVLADANIAALRADPKLAADPHLECWDQDEAVARLDTFDLVLKGPGIPTAGLGLGKRADRITGQADLFLKFAPGRVVGITGTKGKSTTSALLRHLLVSAFGPDDVWLGGNFGVPLWDFIEKLGPESRTVAELSSYQLEYARHAPTVAVWLNLYEEHLNYHGSLDAYRAAKANIVRHLPASGHLVHRADDPGIVRALEEVGLRGASHPFDADSEFPFSLQGNRQLPGRHNRLNALAALRAARLLGVPDEAFQPAFDSYASLPHRLEYLGVVGGVRYYNDSISTVPQATLAALEALPETEVLLVGGMDRGISYQPLADALVRRQGLRLLLLLPETGAIVGRLLKETGLPLPFPIREVESLEEAVALAKQAARPGGVCLLSPAASSYHRYRNFEERGDAFRALVKA